MEGPYRLQSAFLCAVPAECNCGARGVIVADISGNKARSEEYLFVSLLHNTKTRRQHTLTMGPDGPLGPDGPSFPGGPYVETTYNHTWVTTHWGTYSCYTSVSGLYIGFSLESVFLDYIYK